MEKLTIETLAQRVSQLEQLVRSLYRVLETYVTVSDLYVEMEEGEQ